MFMNYNKASNPIDRMLLVMQESCFGFYLTGSRWFDTAKADSDWDFFASHGEVSFNINITIADWLKEKGFALHSGEYTDSSIIAVYRFTPPSFYGDGNQAGIYAQSIDVQLVDEAHTKQMAQEIICTPLLHNMFKDASKAGKAMFWDQALATARRINGL